MNTDDRADTANVPAAHRKIAGMPPTHGVHCWLMAAAWRCWNGKLTAREAIAAIAATSEFLREDREYQPGEIEGAVGKVYESSVYAAPGRNGTSGFNSKTKPQALPEWEPSLTAKIHAEMKATPDNLREISPLKTADLTAEDFVDLLLPGDRLLCCGWKKSQFNTMTRAEWRWLLADMQFIVPTYMTARTGITQEGKVSAHAKSNTGPRIYVVVDFDLPPSDQHSSLVLHLAQRAPLVMALSSGGKSLHAWFKGGTEAQMLAHFTYAARCGADPALWQNHSQFVRMPGGLRDNGNRQEVLYFNPELTVKT